MQLHLQTKIAIGVGLVLAIAAIIWFNSGPADHEKIPVNDSANAKKQTTPSTSRNSTRTATPQHSTTATPDRRRSTNQRPTRSTPPSSSAPNTSTSLAGRTPTPLPTADSSRSSRFPSPISDPTSPSETTKTDSPTASSANRPASTETEKPAATPTLPMPRATTPPADDSRMASRSTMTPPTRPAAAVREHTIESGDTFSSLAIKYYGSERYTSKLVAANSQIKNPNVLKIGQKVRVPTLEALTGGTASASTPTIGASQTTPTRAPAAANTSLASAATTNDKQYRVQQGDTFASIARTKLGDERRWPYLYEINRDKLDGGPDSIRPGMVIILEETSN